ncbi:MAG: hypothetical protein AVDCRST_MAG14-2582, partial [uncultured Rubrobacteraceae bacterium]
CKERAGTYDAPALGLLLSALLRRDCLRPARHSAPRIAPQAPRQRPVRPAAHLPVAPA